MALMYPIKHVFRNWKLFAALLIGIALAATFFAAINMKVNFAADQSLEQQISGVNSDMQFSVNLNESNLAQAQHNITSINGVKSVDFVARVSTTSQYTTSNNYSNPIFLPTFSFPNSSSIYNEWLNKPTGGIGENETWILKAKDSPVTENITIGDNITTGFQFPTPKYDNITTVYTNLTVAGFVQLTDKGYELITGNSFFIPSYSPSGSKTIYNYQADLMIVSWENALQKYWDTMSNRTVSITFQINLDHSKLLSPWDVQASATHVTQIADDINNQILASYEVNGRVQNNLGDTLSSFKYSFQSPLMSFILVSIPVFFVAWYLGYTVSDVSFNMRRREIGLLSTKGLSSGQIQRMFLSEALTIGVIGGVAGVIGGLILNQVFTGGFNLSTLFNPQLLSPYTMVFTVIFGAALGLLSVFFSARKASKLPTVDALRDYMTENNQPHRILPWVALILGSYKMIVYILGVNIPTLLSNLVYSGGNYFLSSIIQPLSLIDSALTYVGPLLFFWGITQLLIKNSQLFQRASSKISGVLGDLASLAAKNVRRNAGRAAAIAFLVALIVGYSVQVTGQVVSQQDYLVRQVQSDPTYGVGADISVSILNASQAPLILSDILGNISGIMNSTMQCQLVQNYAGTTIRTVEPDSWLATAYHEDDWFSGTSMQQAFNAMKANNMTIILERRVAQQLNLKIGDTIGIDFPSGARKLTIVGFFGPAPFSPQGDLGGPSYTLPTWSYVPRNLFNMTVGSDAYKLESFDVQILLKLNPGINGTAVSEQIRGLNLEILGVKSFDEQWQAANSLSNQNQNAVGISSNGNQIVYSSYASSSPNTFYTLQVLDVQNLGVIFAVLSATIGTALIAVVSLRERSREATLMSVRGLSYRQIVWMFLNENIAIITFSVILGIAVGLVIDYGTIVSTGGAASQLIVPRFIYPTSAIENIAIYVAAIYATSIGAILVMSSQYVTKLEKMVRMK